MLLSSLGAVCTYLLFLVLYPLAPSSHVPPGSVPLFFSVLRRPPLPPPPPPSPTTRDQVFHFRPSFLFLCTLAPTHFPHSHDGLPAKNIKVSLPSPLLFFPSLQKRPQKVLLRPFFPRASAPSSLSSSPLALRRQTEEEAIGEAAADEGSHGKTEGERERKERGIQGKEGGTQRAEGDAIAKKRKGRHPFSSFLPPDRSPL